MSPLVIVSTQATCKMMFLILYLLSGVYCLDANKVVAPAKTLCTLPPLINGSTYKVECLKEGCHKEKEVPEKTVLVNRCQPGYMLPENLLFSLCLKGSWVPRPPSCIKLCPPLVNPTRKIECRLGDRVVPCGETMRPGTKASVQCGEYYYPANTDTSFLRLHCQDDGHWNSEIYDCSPECGHHTSKQLSENLTTVAENAPWHGIIYYWEGGNLTELCAGTLISKYVLLTAAHCVYDNKSKTVRDKNILRVIFHQDINDIKAEEYNLGFEAVVRRIVVNDNYEKNVQFSSDLALLDLKYLNDSFVSSVIPACVDWNDLNDQFTPGQPGTVPGWTNENIERFNISHLSIVSDDECTANIPESSLQYFTQDKFCAKDDGGWRNLTSQSPHWDQLVRYNEYLNLDVGSTLVLKNNTAKVRVLPGTGITFVKDKLHFVRGVKSIIEPSESGTFAFTSITKNLDWHYLTRSSVQQFHEEKTYSTNFKDCGLMGSRQSKTGEQNETPWLAIFYENGWHTCGGTIISPHIVLTESQCVRDGSSYTLKDVNTLKVGVGKRYFNQSISEPSEQLLDVKSITIRRRLVEFNLFHEENLAIVELATNIKFTDQVLPVCIDWRNNIIPHNVEKQIMHTPEVRQEFVSTGYNLGLVLPFKDYEGFLDVQMELQPHADCLSYLADFELNRYTENTFCTVFDFRQLNATTNLRRISRGEGATVVVGGRHYLYGLRHYQNTLRASQWHTLYTNITTHVPWLETHRLSLEYDRNFQNCGKVNPKVALISHGKNASQIEHPWHVGLFYFEQGGLYEQKCGGTLVHPQIVLTAAHCVYFNFKLMDVSELVIVVGKIHKDWNVIDPQEKRYNVSSIIIPASYYGSKGTFRDDIALMNLAESVVVSDSVLPACIPKNKDSIPVGSIGSVAGWGLTEKLVASQILQKAHLPTISLESCIAMSPASFKKFLSRDKICTLYLNETGPQVGDSGGGLTFELNGRHYVYGVVSVKPPAENSFGAFTDVIAHFEWIREKTSEIVEDLQWVI